MAKEKKKIDWSIQQFRYVVMHLSYFGWNYNGLAMQREDGNSVENFLQNALRATSLIPEDAKLTDMGYTRAGRTDAGVSASKQIIALFIRSKQKLPATAIGYTDLKSSFSTPPPPWREDPRPKYVFSENTDSLFLDELDYIAAINSKLPADIRVLAWAPAPIHFNARFCAASRTYEYTIEKGNLDVDKMKETASLFTGVHDFRNFCKMDLDNVNSFTREIFTFDIDYHGECLVIRIRGSAFLWHQVRCMMSILMMVGQGLENPSIVSELLDLTLYQAKPNYTMAADYPLCLVDTEYPLYDFGMFKSQTNMMSLLCHAARERMALIVKARQWDALINQHLSESSLILPQMDAWGSTETSLAYSTPLFYPLSLPSPFTKHQKLADRPRDPTYEEKMSKRRKD